MYVLSLHVQGVQSELHSRDSSPLPGSDSCMLRGLIPSVLKTICVTFRVGGIVHCIANTHRT